jgi:quinol monooxygenase YgiN
MAYLEVIARAKVRPGQLDGVKPQAAEILRVTREQDTDTLRCDWFINEDGTECEVHEIFSDEQRLIEHKMHTMQATSRLFRDYAYDHRSTLYGEVSENFLNLVNAQMGRHQPSSRSCRASNGRQRFSHRVAAASEILQASDCQTAFELARQAERLAANLDDLTPARASRAVGMARSGYNQSSRCRLFAMRSPGSGTTTRGRAPSPCRASRKPPAS